MIRKILGVLGGYAAIFFITFVSYTIFYLAIGADLAYDPGTYDVSMLWIGVSTVLGFIAAVIGGYLCRVIAKDRSVTVIFAGIVLGIGLAAAIMLAVAPKATPEVRTAEVSDTEAMQKSITPVWVLFMNPFISAIGVWVGGGIGKNEE